MSGRPAPALAEVQWTWRRVFAMGRGLVIAALLFAIVRAIGDPATLKVIALALIGSDVLSALLYMAGATVTDVMRLVVAVKQPAPPAPRTQP